HTKFDCYWSSDVCSYDLLLLAFVFRVADRHLTAYSVDFHVDRPRKRRPLLHEVVADQPELLPLREDRCVVVQRSILEMKHEAARSVERSVGIGWLIHYCV